MSEMFKAEINPDRVKEADLVVSIPSYNEGDAIAYPTARASEGLVKYFPGKRCVIINCDNNSPDNTREVFLNTSTEAPKIYISTPPGVRGKGNNFRNLFQKVVDLKAKAIVVVDADLKSITPEWIKHLGEPLFSGFSFVAPLYVRHKYDGTITNGIAYPLTRALYGRRVRQPIGGEFGFSGKLAETFLQSEIWDDSVAHFGIDIWMSTLALNEGVPCCQSFMGTPKVHRPKDPASALGPMFKQVVGTLFSLMSHFEPFWTGVRHSKPTAIYGFGLGETEMPPKVEVDAERLIQGFYQGFDEYGPAWEAALSRDVYMKLLEMKGMRSALFSFPTDLWARILYDMAIYYRNEPGEQDAMLESLIPLYFGRTYSFVRKTRRMSTRQAEEAIEEDCITFETTKPYLVKKWTGPKPPADAGQ